MLEASPPRRSTRMRRPGDSGSSSDAGARAGGPGSEDGPQPPDSSNRRICECARITDDLGAGRPSFGWDARHAPEGSAMTRNRMILTSMLLIALCGLRPVAAVEF